MAKDESPSPDALKKDPDTVIPRMALAEVGTTGLKISSGEIIQESQRSFRFPYFIQTVEEMRNNPTVGAAMNVYRFMLTEPNWRVKQPATATKIEIERAEITNTMLHDMEHSWGSFMNSLIPYLEYGFSIHNIVPYRRLTRNGSKYNDGLVGIRKLPVRNQNTIRKWRFNDSGDTLLKVEQSVDHIEDYKTRFKNINENGNIDLPRSSFLLFTASPTAGNPQGNSMFKNIYLSFKQLTLLQDQQLLSVTKDVQGQLKIEVPTQYMAGEQSVDKGATVESLKKVISTYNRGESSGMIVPQIVDSESKLKHFDYSLMESKGGARNNTAELIKGLQNDIAQALSVDILKLGANGSGSFALAESKTSILALAIDSRLREIQSVLNSELIPFIYRMNGWELTNLPTFEYGDVEEINLDSLGSFLQRVGAADLIEVDRDVMNMVRRAVRLEEKPEDEPVDWESVPSAKGNPTSKSGDSMTPANDTQDTGKAPADKSKANPYNAP